MTDLARHAIYFTPAPHSALWRFGCQVLGYDATGGSAPEPLPGLEAARAAGVFAEPARYGFHATLKAPFELAAGTDEASLAAAAEAFAANCARVSLGRLEVARFGRFLALVPAAAPVGLAALADECVREFEPFRAPLSAADRARRLAANLSPRQIAHLDRWGYPQVFDEFHFHMTLTGAIPDDPAGGVLGELRRLHAAIDVPVTLDAIALLRQPNRAAPFRVIGRYGFGRSGVS